MGPALGGLDGRDAALVAVAVVGVVAVLALLAGGLPGAGDDRYEPNDDFEGAAALERGVHGDLRLSAGERDFYAVSLSANQTVAVTVRFEHAEGDLDLEAYGPDARILARSDSVTDDESLTVTAEESGTHFLLVHGRGDDAADYGIELASEEPVAE